MRILITGSNGLLGQYLVEQIKNLDVEFLGTSIGANRNTKLNELQFQSLDITNEDQVKQVCDQFQPTHMIHTAAVTNVDQCELDPKLCQKVNVQATQFLFEEAVRINAHFQLLSTDFVFDGQQGNYKETDLVHPLSVYGQSKVDAENLLIQSSYSNWSIVRTIIVYGVGENLSRGNLISWSKSMLEEGKDMNVVDDQFRAPTYADDLAKGCLAILQRQKTGIYHLSGPETYSIFDIVTKIADHYGFDKSKVHRISSATLNQPAKRPPFTGFDLTKAKLDLAYQPLTLEQTLQFL